MFCPKCGNQIEENATFCSKCGEKIKDAVASEVTSAPESNLTSNVKKVKQNPIIIAVVAVVLITIISAVYSIEIKPNKILKSVQKAHFASLPGVEIADFLDETHENPYRTDEEPEWLMLDGKYPEFHGRNIFNGCLIVIHFTGEVDKDGIAEVNYVEYKFSDDNSFTRMHSGEFENYLINFS